jgi:hypothetical protein
MLIVACGAQSDGEELGADESEPGLQDDVVHPPDLAPAEPETVPYTGATSQIIYVNFEGGRIHDCNPFCSDAPGNRSTVIGQIFGATYVDFEPYASAAGRQTIVAEIERAYGDYAVTVTTTRPAVPPYTMLIVSPTNGPHHGVAPLNCDNSNPNDIAFVYSIANSSARWIAQAGVHELGHSFGLSHVTGSADYMQWASSGDRFTVSTYDTGHVSGKCFEGNQQDGPAMLYAALGVHPFDGAFYDDDGNMHESSIDAIFAAGITSGCGNAGLRPLYCPSALVTRAQMAVFLQRAFALSGSGENYFDDDDGAWYEPAANAVASAGITVGCGERRYCGPEQVTRGQMAVFLTRALDLPATSADYFDDDTGTYYEQSANRMYEAGITVGCGTRRYCGAQAIPRDQMATFLARALDLP